MAIELKEEDYDLINTHLAELEQIEKDVSVGKEIGVKNIEFLDDRCRRAKGKCSTIKKHCFPNRP